MSATRGFYARLPADIVRAIKVDAAQRDMTIQEWMLEAVQAKLPAVRAERNGETAAAE